MEPRQPPEAVPFAYALSIYYYLIDPILGFLHVRIQTWFPLTIQIYDNGHDWLARQMDQHNLAYERIDNAFVSIGDGPFVQSLADEYIKLDWPALLGPLAQRVNPLLGDLLAKDYYYWTLHQAEFSTNVLFKDREALRDLDHACFATPPSSSAPRTS